MGEETKATIPMTLVDALPVLFFCGSCLLVSSVFPSRIFLLGACSCLVAGMGKVVWKLLLAVRKINIRILNRQFRYLLPIGFFAMVAAVLINQKQVDLRGMVKAMEAAPAGFFFIIGVIGFMLMGILAWRMEESVRANWIEQGVNTITQLSFFLGILFAVSGK